MFVLRAARSLTASCVLAGLVVGGGQLAMGAVATAGSTTAIATATVNVRTAPGTRAAILGQVPQGAKVVATGNSRGGWTPVRFAGRQAWIASDYLSPAMSSNAVSTNTGSAGTARTTSSLNVRSGPGISSSIIDVLGVGATVHLTGNVAGAWAQISLPGQKAWVNTAWLTRSAGAAPTALAAKAKVASRARATTDLKIRDSSGAGYRSLGVIDSGTLLSLTGVRAPGVAQIIWQGELRWVNANYLAGISSSTGVQTPSAKVIGYRYATSALNIRTSSSGDGVVDVVEAGTKLGVTGTVQGGRAQVVYQGAIRWVTARYLADGAGVASSVRQPRSLATGGNLNVNGSEGCNAMLPQTKRVLAAVRANFGQMETFYGVRSDPLPDHPSGHAVDAMLPDYRNNEALGWQIAKYLQAHAAELDIKYIIFHQHIWSVARDGEGWREMADRGGDTANHFDHVHITTN